MKRRRKNKNSPKFVPYFSAIFPIFRNFWKSDKKKTFVRIRPHKRSYCAPSPWTSPEVPRTSPEVFGRLPRKFSHCGTVPGSFPNFPGSSPSFPRGSPSFPGGQPLSLGGLTPSPGSQKLSRKNRNSRKWLREGAKGLLDPGSKGLPRVSCTFPPKSVLHRCHPILRQCKRAFRSLGPKGLLHPLVITFRHFLLRLGLQSQLI